jgi:hypothetical protein
VANLASLCVVASGLLAGLLGGCTTRSPGPDPSALEQKARGIDHQNRLLLANALATGKTRVVVLIATTRGASAQVAHDVTALGGKVWARFDDVGYLRVMLPISAFDELRASPTVIDAAVDAGALDYMHEQGTDPAAVELVMKKWLAMSPPRATLGASTHLPPVPDEARAPENPFIPMGNMGAPQFTAAHPSFDGRGVTIGVLEWGGPEGGILDVLHPTLQSALTLAGDSVAKIRGIITPSAYDRWEVWMPGGVRDTTILWMDTTADHSHIRPTNTVDPSTASFTAGGTTYTVPTPGAYQFGVYKSVAGKSYGVLWDAPRTRVWVDTDRDHDFRDEHPLSDINVAFSAGYLRGDSTAAHPAPSHSFAVAFDSAAGGVYVYEGTATHQTMTASLAAGVHFLGGQANSPAPGAQLVIVNAGRSLGDAIEGFIRAARDPRVDLITSSQIGERFPDAGQSIVGVILQRLFERYRKPTFVAAANSSPIITRTEESGNAPGVIAVGGYVGRDTYRAHYGWDVPGIDHMYELSAWGPTVDGALKPDLLAPPLSIAAFPCGVQPFTHGPTVYALPPCYMLGGGTSAATPAAAGAGALLMSAAKQTGIQVDAARLAWALTTGARYLKQYHPYQEGNGLLDVAGAWQLLDEDVDLPTIVVAAPVHTALDRYLRVPGEGRGLFERAGWIAGNRGTRTIRLTRTAGGQRRYSLRWLGNDGTFATRADEIAMPLGKTVSIPIQIAPATAGVHSAALELVDQTSGLSVLRVPATIVAAEPFTSANQWTIRHTAHLSWLQPANYFIAIPSGAVALRVDVAVRRGAIAVHHEDADNTGLAEFPGILKPYEYPFARNQYVTAGQVKTELVPAPRAGVWDFAIVPATPSPQKDSMRLHEPSDITVTFRMFGARAATTPIAGGARVSFTATMGQPAEGRIVAERGARRVVSGIADSLRGPASYALTVDSEVTSLRVKVEPTTDTTAELDLYLYDCTSGHCYLWDVNHRSSAAKSLLVRHPSAGAWKVLIDPAHVPGGGGRTPFRYTTITTGPRYGRVAIAPVISPRANATSWTSTVVTKGAGAQPAEGWESVIVSDLIDAGAEHSEAAHPLYPFLTVPYRPAIIATAVAPVASR